jgi:hypothetical protein
MPLAAPPVQAIPQVGVAAQSTHEQGSPMSHVPLAIIPEHVAFGPQAGVPAQSAHEQGSPAWHMPLATPPVQVGLGALTHSGFVAQSAQTQPSRYGSHVPLFVQFAGFEQYESVSQSAQTQSSAVVHTPSATHVAWQPGDAVQSEHAHDSPAWHIPFARPPVQAIPQVGVAKQSGHEQGSPASHIMLAAPPVHVGSGPQAGVAAQSGHEQGSPMSHIPFATIPVHVAFGPQAGVIAQSAHAHVSPISHVPSVSQATTHSGFVAQSAHTQPSRYGLHIPSLVQFAGSEQYESVSQSEQTQSSSVVHVPSVTHIAWQPGAAMQSTQSHASPASHIPFAMPPVQLIWQAGVAAQSAHEQGSPASHIAFAVPPIHVGSVPHCGAVAQSAHAHISPMSHVPFMLHTGAHAGLVAQSPQTQPSLYGSQTPSLLQFIGFEQNESLSQSSQTQSSSAPHIPFGTHVAWQPAVAAQSPHVHASKGSHMPFDAPPVQPT